MKNCKKALSILLCLLMLVSLLPGSVLALESAEAEPEAALEEAAEVSAEEAELPTEAEVPAEPEAAPEEVLVEDEPTQAPEYLGTESVAINSTNFPDANFRSFVSENCDTNGDNSLSAAEIAAVTKIDCSSKSIANLKGIEYFTALKELTCSGNQLTSLNISKNTALTKLYCYNNQLSSLDVSMNTALTYLSCPFNKLTALDVSKNTKLTFLGCYNNQLTSLDISKNTSLTELNCDSNRLTALDVSQNTKLTRLYCEYNRLTALDVTKNTALQILTCSGNQLTSLDVTKNTALWILFCSGNQLTTLDISKNPALSKLWCHNNRLISLDIYNTAIFSDVKECYFGTQKDNLTIRVRMTQEQLDVFNSSYASRSDNDRVNVQLVAAKTINSSNFPDTNFRNYISSNFDTNGDSVLSVDEIAAVTRIFCNGKSIASLVGVEYFFNLDTLFCYDNSLTSLDVSQNTKLTSLLCYANNLTSLDLSHNPLLTGLSCDDNRLTALDVSETRVFTISDQSTVGNQKNSKSITVTMTEGQADFFMQYCSDNSDNSGVIINARDADSLITSFYAYTDEPEHGARPDYSYNETKEYDVTDVSWAEGTDYQVDYFYYHQDYTYYITFIANDGYTFAANCVFYLNGKVVTPTKNSNGSYTISKTFTSAYCMDRADINGFPVPTVGAKISKAWGLPPDYDWEYSHTDSHPNGYIWFKNGLAVTDPDAVFEAGNSYSCVIYINPDRSTEYDRFSKYTVVYINNSKDYVDASGLEDGVLKIRTISFAPETAIDETNFPDANFRSYVSGNFDKDSNGKLSKEELAAVTEISCGRKSIASLKGIEYFTALTRLDCYGNQLTQLDVSKNPALISLYCNSNQLTSLDVSKNTALIELYCNSNQLNTLNIGNCSALISLECYGNKLTSLDISGTGLAENTYWSDFEAPVDLGSQQDDKTITVIMTEAQLAVYNAQTAAIKVRITTLISGDVNSDGHATLADVSLLYKYLTGKVNASALNRTPADLTMDGKLTLRDVSALFSRCAK